MLKLLLFTVLLTFTTKTSSKQVSLGTVTGSYPNLYTYLGSYSSGTDFRITAVCNGDIQNMLMVLGKGGGLSSISPFLLSTTSSTTTTEINYRTEFSGQFWIKFNQIPTKYLQCQLTAVLDNDPPGRKQFSFHSTTDESPIHKVSLFGGACKLKLDLSGISVNNVQVYDEAALPSFTNYIARLGSTGEVNIPAQGNYYIVIHSNSRGSVPTDYTLNLISICGNLCKPNPDFNPSCASCGDGVRNQGEECDNGGQKGCAGCVVTPGFSCQGDIDSPSVCRKIPACGDGVLDEGEQCDNYDRPGCSHCAVVPGYVCQGRQGFQSVCKNSVCGDGIRGEEEECDNGNRVGCVGCATARDYVCVGGVGATSYCTKQPSPAVCGNGIVDRGEECDNGNRTGCAFNCKTDAGYQCTASLGLPSVCTSCGNGIIEPGEECDNQHELGCSFGCKVDSGYSCRGLTSSFCYRRDPICGNKVIEVGESCDDGNKISGDGCGSACLVENGYACSGEPSKCQRKSTSSAFCGNGIFQPSSNEQCDNGNKEGCFNCVVQKDWQCRSQAGSASICSPKVVIPHCGNGLFEPFRNQICDDGNTENGDGCDNFCQIQPGWICLDNENCFNTQDPTRTKNFCGNGKLQEVYGENCDDGNAFDQDGCSSACKIEEGWDCQVYSPVENKSYCARQIYAKGFCGNGVVERNEECDDGFPVKNQDGCSTRCKIEQGWNCWGGKNQVSRCWRIFE